ncbi:MAG: PQQ-dependent sugar dehydrogenase [Candidatus Acidiferrales bacterium]
MVTLGKSLKNNARLAVTFLAVLGFSTFLMFPSLKAQNSRFHDAPASADASKNPYAGQQAAAEAGGKTYAANCAGCHGQTGQGTGNIPQLAGGPAQTANDGELFWFITNGSLNNGMPSWKQLSDEQRWQLVTLIKTAAWSSVPAAPAASAHAAPGGITAPPPNPPFTDFRYEKPGNTRKITVADLPAPFATQSSTNRAQLAPRPADVFPKAPAGFKVDLYATDLKNPRTIRRAPNGDSFLAESEPGNIKVFRGITSDSKPQQVEVYASGLKRPYGLAFYPPGNDPKWLYVGDTDAVIRFPYQNGDLKARGPAEHIVDLPSGGGHWTRSVQFSPDGKRMFVSVGSASNVDDPDTHPAEKNRADILSLNPDGSDLKVYAYGIRNSGGGLAMDPKTGELWCSTNERDALGDNLVPDYITHVQEGGFYGWPWWYMGGHQDPRLIGTRPELKDKVITPDVVLQPHNASLGITFYDGKQFPKQFDDDIFASEHGSWNKSVRVGYEVIRIPRHQTGKATGEYEDFLTGFVLPNGQVWGRPVGIAVAQDGSLLVSDDGSNSIWRVSYTGKQ